jgi:hypothetical protein
MINEHPPPLLGRGFGDWAVLHSRYYWGYWG